MVDILSIYNQLSSTSATYFFAFIGAFLVLLSIPKTGNGYNTHIKGRKLSVVCAFIGVSLLVFSIILVIYMPKRSDPHHDISKSVNWKIAGTIEEVIANESGFGILLKTPEDHKTRSACKNRYMVYRRHVNYESMVLVAQLAYSNDKLVRIKADYESTACYIPLFEIFIDEE